MSVLSPERVWCKSETRKGRRCKLEADQSTGFCSVHDPALRCNAKRHDGQRCQVTTGGGRCKFHETIDA